MWHFQVWDGEHFSITFLYTQQTVNITNYRERFYGYYYQFFRWKISLIKALSSYLKATHSTMILFTPVVVDLNSHYWNPLPLCGTVVRYGGLVKSAYKMCQLLMGREGSSSGRQTPCWHGVGPSVLVCMLAPPLPLIMLQYSVVVRVDTPPL